MSTFTAISRSLYTCFEPSGINVFIPAVTITSRGAQMGTSKVPYNWPKINSINMQSLLAKSGVCLEQNKLQLPSATGVSAV